MRVFLCENREGPTTGESIERASRRLCVVFFGCGFTESFGSCRRQVWLYTKVAGGRWVWVWRGLPQKPSVGSALRKGSRRACACGCRRMFFGCVPSWWCQRGRVNAIVTSHAKACDVGLVTMCSEPSRLTPLLWHSASCVRRYLHSTQHAEVSL